MEDRALLTAYRPGYAAPAWYLVRCLPGSAQSLRIELSGPELVLEGLVSDPDGLAIPGAEVELISTNRIRRVEGDLILDEGISQERTDASGAFTMRGLEPGVHTLAVRASGWVPSEQTVDGRAGGRVECALPLTKAGSVSGIVRDERGDPLPGAVVRVWATHESSILGRHLTIDHVGTANAESSYLGAIDLEHGPIVTMELEISAPGFAPQRFPQTIPEGARWVRRDLVLRDGVVLRGTLVDEHGAPCCGWTVAPCGFPIRTTFDRTRADGSFEIRGMADWECTVTAREPDGVEHAFPAIRPAGGSVALRLPPAPSAADGEEGR